MLIAVVTIEGSIVARATGTFGLLLLQLLDAFAASAFLLALVGIYGVISYIVVQRTREIGIRVALGAGRQDVVWMVARHGMRIALLSVAVGRLCPSL